MSRLGALAVLLGLTVPMACASIYGITDLPSEQGADASTDGGADANGHPKPDASSHPDAKHEAGHDTGVDGGHDGGHDATTGTDAQDATHAGDGGAPDAATDAPKDAPVSIIAAVTPSPVTVLTGGTASLTVTLTSPQAADVQVSMASLPTGVSTTPITVTAGNTSGMLTLTATASATEGTATPTVTAGSSTQPASLVVAGASGTLDTSFNESGVQNVTPPGGSGSSTAVSIAVQPDGAILVAGSSGTASGAWELVRLNPDGSLDAAFNANVIDSSKGATLPGSGSVAGVAVIPGSGLIAVGGIDDDDSETNLAVLLLNADGSRHESFGVAGLYERGGAEVFHVTTVGGLAVSADGAIALTGNTSTGAYVITLSGSTNSTFNETTAFPSGVGLHGIAYDPSGNVLVGGTSPDSEGGQFYVARFTGALAASGLLDGGVQGPPSTANQYLTAATIAAIAVDSNGNSFLVGYDDKNDPTPAVTYVPTTGSPLLTNGYTLPGPGLMNSSGYVAVATTANGDAVAVENGYDQAGNLTAVVRLTPAGALDPTFATGGKLEPAASMTGPLYSAVAIDGVGRILVAGNGGNGFYIMRIWP